VSPRPVWRAAPDGVDGIVCDYQDREGAVWSGPQLPEGKPDYRYLVTRRECVTVCTHVVATAGAIMVAYRDGFATQDAARAQATQVLETGVPVAEVGA